MDQPQKKFTRLVEDFRCDKCGLEVVGSGYTNHCPRCLWSRHVDRNPGDRAAVCGGAMEPSGVEMKGGEYIITHKCKSCGLVRRITASPTDNIECIIELSTRPA